LLGHTLPKGVLAHGGHQTHFLSREEEGTPS
jgi:hypothetical protein